MIDAFILCGGLGTRFRDVSNDYPKALAPVGNRKVIDLIIEKLMTKNVGNIILGTGYLSDQLSAHVEDKEYKNIIVSKEPKPLGTGGAISYALDKFNTEDILVLNGDTIVDFDLIKLLSFHKEKKANCTILAAKSDQANEYGNIKKDSNGLVLDFAEKNSRQATKYVNAGVYIIKKESISKLPKKGSLEKDYFPIFCDTKKLFCLTTNCLFHDIGTKSRYDAFRSYVER